MKSIFRTFLIPIFTILFAIVSSFNTHAEEKRRAPIDGFYKPAWSTSADMCPIRVSCSTLNGPFCTAEDLIDHLTYQAWGKASATDMVCPIVRFRLP